ncbi:hypothetical protein [Corynebacterium glyciniphilum]|nr:hypothetical protein [Corynebacterium glyciniphilum]MDN5684405.1 hypothetical protein [Corynebacterium glyciniphilum]MDN6706806.1 hypothetical protein [Corynebacterium glyciniphilum]
MSFKDLFTKKKNTTDNPASSCCNVEIVPDDPPSNESDAGDSTQGHQA